MSWDVYIRNEVGDAVQIPYKELPTGGIYLVGCEDEEKVDARLNVTYNYSQFYRKLRGEASLYHLHEMPVLKAIPIIESAVWALGTKRHEDYWAKTPGNAGAALNDIFNMCWEMDYGWAYHLEVY